MKIPENFSATFTRVSGWFTISDVNFRCVLIKNYLSDEGINKALISVRLARNKFCQRITYGFFLLSPDSDLQVFQRKLLKFFEWQSRDREWGEWPSSRYLRVIVEKNFLSSCEGDSTAKLQLLWLAVSNLEVFRRGRQIFCGRHWQSLTHLAFSCTFSIQKFIASSENLMSTRIRVGRWNIFLPTPF